jgi:predicted alpha/beta hydrolase family esterase
MRNVILVPGFNGVSVIFRWFEKELNAKGYNVIITDCPLREEITWAGYEDALNKIKDKLDDSIIIAHSIGCAMSVKYVAESNTKPFAYISLAGFGHPFVTPERPDLDKAVAETEVLQDTGKKFAEIVPNRFSLFSNNDHVVPRELLEEFPQIIAAKAIEIPNVGHMGSKSGLEKFPEVTDIIESL